MRWGIDSNVFIHLDLLAEKCDPNDTALALLSFCEKQSGNVSEILCLGNQIGGSKTLSHLQEIVPVSDLSSFYSDKELVNILEDLCSKLKRIYKNHPEYPRYSKLKRYLSHFQSSKFDIYDICFFLAHRDGRIEFSLVCDGILFTLLKTFRFKTFFCKNKPGNPYEFLSEDNCKP